MTLITRLAARVERIRGSKIPILPGEVGKIGIWPPRLSPHDPLGVDHVPGPASLLLRVAILSLLEGHAEEGCHLLELPAECHSTTAAMDGEKNFGDVPRLERARHRPVRGGVRQQQLAVGNPDGRVVRRVTLWLDTRCPHRPSRQPSIPLPRNRGGEEHDEPAFTKRRSTHW